LDREEDVNVLAGLDIDSIDLTPICGGICCLWCVFFLAAAVAYSLYQTQRKR
jgi:hypothetical protein